MRYVTEKEQEQKQVAGGRKLQKRKDKCEAQTRDYKKLQKN